MSKVQIFEGEKKARIDSLGLPPLRASRAMISKEEVDTLQNFHLYLNLTLLPCSTF
jgi:hypothetical protein